MVRRIGDGVGVWLRGGGGDEGVGVFVAGGRCV